MQVKKSLNVITCSGYSTATCCSSALSQKPPGAWQFKTNYKQWKPRNKSASKSFFFSSTLAVARTTCLLIYPATPCLLPRKHVPVLMLTTEPKLQAAEPQVLQPLPCL